jgi:AcrR family transcriptional regulator
MEKTDSSPSTRQKNARERILAAAAETFQSLGYARTTTQAVAERAGVAEVTLFRHFGDKQKLFLAAIQQVGGGPEIAKVAAQLIGEPETDLRLIADHILTFFFTQQEAIRMLLFESTHFPEMQEALAQNPRGMLHLLMQYFTQQIAAGTLRPVMPGAAAQMFVSMLFGYAIAIAPIQDLLPTQVPRAAMTAHFVELFLRGTAVSLSPAAEQPDDDEYTK